MIATNESLVEERSHFRKSLFLPREYIYTRMYTINTWLLLKIIFSQLCLLWPEQAIYKKDKIMNWRAS